MTSSWLKPKPCFLILPSFYFDKFETWEEKGNMWKQQRSPTGTVLFSALSPSYSFNFPNNPVKQWLLQTHFIGKEISTVKLSNWPKARQLARGKKTQTLVPEEMLFDHWAAVLLKYDDMNNTYRKKGMWKTHEISNSHYTEPMLG